MAAFWIDAECVQSAMTSHWLFFSIAVIDSVRCSEAAIAPKVLLLERQLCIADSTAIRA